MGFDDAAMTARAAEIMELCGCSRESALWAAREYPHPADIETAVEFVLSVSAAESISHRCAQTQNDLR